MANSAFDAMAVASESLGTEIHRKATHSSVWMNLIPKSTFKGGSGFVQTTFTAENSLPTSDTETWSELSSSSLSDGTGDNVGVCDTAWNDVNLGYSTRQYQPESYALRGPIICSTDLIFEHNVNAFLSAYVQELTKRAKFSMENKLQNEYAKFAKKVMLTGSEGTAAITAFAGGTAVEAHTDAGGNEFAQADPSAVDLEQSHLDLLAQELIEEGATEGDSNGWITLDEAGPVFPLLIGMEASNKIVKNSGSDYRNDLRYGEPNQLLKRIGASRILGNFRHVPTVMPMRYDWNDTTKAFERVNQYVEADATKGKKYTINPDWKAATHEAAVVLNPSVYTAEAVRPVTSAGGLSWSPQNYNGDWKWVTGLNNISDSTTAVTTGTDPFQKLGRHFCEYMYAMKPVRPDDGMVIIFTR
jgi:hypothetical protein